LQRGRSQRKVKNSLPSWVKEQKRRTQRESSSRGCEASGSAGPRNKVKQSLVLSDNKEVGNRPCSKEEQKKRARRRRSRGFGGERKSSDNQERVGQRVNRKNQFECPGEVKVGHGKLKDAAGPSAIRQAAASNTIRLERAEK